MLKSLVVPANAGTHSHRQLLDGTLAMAPFDGQPVVMGPCVRRDDV